MRPQAWFPPTAVTVAVACALAAGFPSPVAAAKPAKPAPTASPAPAATARASAKPSVTPTPSVQARARAAYDGIVHGTFDRSQLSPALSAELTAMQLDGYARVLGPFGAPQSFALADMHDDRGTTTYDYVVRYAEGRVSFTFGIDDVSQKISKMYVRPN